MGNKKKNLENDTGFRCLSKDQLALAATLAARHELDIPIETLADYVFGKRFIDLFAFDPDKSDMTGFRRVSVIESYLYLDKNQTHLQFKLELAPEDISFMVMVLAEYKFKGVFPREDLTDPDPVRTSFEKLEEEIFQASYNV